MLGEEWKTIIDFPNYEISNLGRVKRKERIFYRKGFPVNLPEILLKFNYDYTNYATVKLYNKENYKTFLVHRIVANHFILNLSNLKYVNHINGDKQDNKATNLEWVSFRENICHRIDKTKTLSKYIGVSYYPNLKINKWYAYITVNKKSISLGYYFTEEDAYNARKNFELKNKIENKYL